MFFRGLGSNRLIFLAVLFGIGFFLYYGDKPSPFRTFKNDLFGLFGISANGSFKPPIFTDEATDDRRESSTYTSLEAYLPAFSKKDQVVRHDGFILNYVEKYEQASWVVHALLNKTGKAKRAENFQPDPAVETRTALPNDYQGTGYDRGHLAPAGDFNYDQNLKYETFLMSNMSPQLHAFNTGIWNDIEQKVRSWSKRRGDLIIVTGPVLQDGLPTIGRSTDISIPKRYYKIVYDPATEESIAFLIENKEWVEVLMKDFTTSIDKVEAATGLDFFAKFPKGKQSNLESQHDVDAWFGRRR